MIDFIVSFRFKQKLSAYMHCRKPETQISKKINISFRYQQVMTISLDFLIYTITCVLRSVTASCPALQLPNCGRRISSFQKSARTLSGPPLTHCWRIGAKAHGAHIVTIAVTQYDDSHTHAAKSYRLS